MILLEIYTKKFSYLDKIAARNTLYCMNDFCYSEGYYHKKKKTSIYLKEILSLLFANIKLHIARLAWRRPYRMISIYILNQLIPLYLLILSQ